jgi:hypothetical protein
MQANRKTKRRQRLRRLAFVLALFLPLAGLAGCQKAAAPSSADQPHGPVWFQDVTDQVGLNFVHDPGPPGSFFMPEHVGSGVALFDYDNDGRLDIYLLQNRGPNSSSTNRLFHQESDGRFTDVSAGSGLDVAGYGMGVAIGDVNNDGWPDVLITEYGRIRLFLNNGNGTFTDVTKESGLENTLWGTSACFVDYDRDGWLDLVVVNYVDYDAKKRCDGPAGQQEYCGPNAFPGTVAKLYRNLGRTASASPSSPVKGDKKRGGMVRFEDVTVKSGLGRLAGPGLGVVCADFNGDRWPDILIANDGKPNHLWINQRDGTFKEEAVMRGLAYNAMGKAEANMGIAVGDVTGDGLFDVFVTHLNEETNTLWVQGPRGMFQDRTVARKLAHPRWRSTGFGTLLADFDHDGALDLAIANGHIKPPPRPAAGVKIDPTLSPFWKQYADRNQLFVNDGNGQFRDISPENGPFCGTARVARGLACGDIDGDGALDLVVTNVAGQVRVYRNQAPKRGHWLLVRAVDPVLGGRDAYGAEITVQAGGRRWVRLLNPGYSYLCSNDPRVHFGLGPNQRVDAIQVIWPDGTEEAFPGQTVDQVVVLRKGEGKIGK